MSGWESTSFERMSLIYAVSREGFLMNFFLAGVLKNRFSTVTVVPSERPASFMLSVFPPLFTSMVPSSSSGVLVLISTIETAAMLERASPLNPMEFMCSRS